METVINLTDEGNQRDQGEPETFENEQFTVCRICFDDKKKENLVSPCYCLDSHGIVHASCLEKWINLSKKTNCDVCQYNFKTIRYTLTLFECLRRKELCREFFLNFSAFITLIVIWTLLTLLCGVRSVINFLDFSNIKSFSRGWNMAFMASFLLCVLFLWLVIFNSIFKWWIKTKTETRLDFNEDIPVVQISNGV